MDERDVGKLQIHAVEDGAPATAVCVVRCVGGVVRRGQTFDVTPHVDDPAADSRISLAWIERYGRRIEFVDPPHSARVLFTGAGVSALTKGITVEADA